MENLKHIWYIALKDLKIFVSDRASLWAYIAFPFLFIALFNFLLQGAWGNDQRLELHLVTQEAEGGLSHQIIGAMVTGNETLLNPGEPVIIWDKDYNAARQSVEDGKLGGFLSFPANFTESIMSSSGTKLDIYADAGAMNMKMALEGVAGYLASRFNSDMAVIKASSSLLAQSGATQEEILAEINSITGKLFSGENAAASYLTVKTEKVGDYEQENPSNFVVPGYLVMFVFMACDITARMIVRERRNRTLERLMSTSVNRAAILGGYFAGSAFRGLVQAVIFWTVGILVFHIDMGKSPAAIIVLTFLMVILSSAFGVMLATFTRTERSAGALGSIASLLFAAMGGCWWPAFLYPEWLQNFTKIIPHAWATEGFNKVMLFGANFGDAVPSMLALIIFTLAFSAIGIWRFRTGET
jgi:ABC-2 type transport system permease protein